MCIVLLQDRKVAGGGDGSWDDKRYFTCKDGHAIFIVLKRLLPDRRVRRGHSAGGGRLIVHSHLLHCSLGFRVFLLVWSAIYIDYIHSYHYVYLTIGWVRYTSLFLSP